MSIELIRTNFDNAIFNDEFEKNKRQRNAEKQKIEEERLRKMNQEIYVKELRDMSINELLIEWKMSHIGILNDLINLRWNPYTLFGENRLLFIGITIIVFAILFCFINWLFGFKIKSENKNVNEFRIFVENDATKYINKIKYEE
jgi:hypothetical protein